MSKHREQSSQILHKGMANIDPLYIYSIHFQKEQDYEDISQNIRAICYITCMWIIELDAGQGCQTDREGLGSKFFRQNKIRPAVREQCIFL